MYEFIFNGARHWRERGWKIALVTRPAIWMRMDDTTSGIIVVGELVTQIGMRSYSFLAQNAGRAHRFTISPLNLTIRFRCLGTVRKLCMKHNKQTMYEYKRFVSQKYILHSEAMATISASLPNLTSRFCSSGVLLKWWNMVHKIVQTIHAIKIPLLIIGCRSFYSLWRVKRSCANALQFSLYSVKHIHILDR